MEGTVFRRTLCLNIQYAFLPSASLTEVVNILSKAAITGENSKFNMVCSYMVDGMGREESRRAYLPPHSGKPA